MTNRFKGKVAVVTGGGSGIGRALCEALGKAGARVIVADIDIVSATRIAAIIVANGGRASAAYVDVSRMELVQALVSDTVSNCGRLDYVFNNAAASASRGELHVLPLEPWYRAIDVNLLGVLYGTVSAYSVMIRQGFGHIVNMGSIAGLVGFPTSIPYGSTKAAVVNLSFSLRVEAAEQNVKVSVVCPGPVHASEEHGKLIGVDRAACLILKGVERNQAIIVFPWSARLVWWLHRLSPDLFLPVARRLIRKSWARQPTHANAEEPEVGSKIFAHLDRTASDEAAPSSS
jgi:NAD(P)-dependent dehydrogenase (short-subunit alcohol dehydrogenase family)